MLIRQELVTAALVDYPALHKQLSGLSKAEVIHALELESGSRRRNTILRRLVRRATRLNELEYREALEARYMHEPSEIMKAVVKKKLPPKKKKAPKKK